MGRLFDNENRKILNEWRKRLNEDYEDAGNEQDDEAVPYTMQDEIMQTTIETMKNNFGADFTEVKSPMMYYPKSKDIELNGTIPAMDDAKFQFRRKGGVCNIWTNQDNPLKLNDETVRTISVIFGSYKNWIKSDIPNFGDCKPMTLKNGDVQGDNMQQQGSNMVPGDDF